MARVVVLCFMLLDVGSVPSSSSSKPCPDASGGGPVLGLSRTRQWSRMRHLHRINHLHRRSSIRHNPMRSPMRSQPQEWRQLHDDADIPTKGFLGGPIDTSVLRTYADHVATRLWSGEDRQELRLFSNGKKLKDVVVHAGVMRYVQGSQLLPLLECSHGLVDKGLVSAFVERWHRDTNSFHLPVGEMTITLDDVWSLLHIPITGAFFTVTVFDRDQAAGVMRELLGVTRSEAKLEFRTTKQAAIRYTELLDIYRRRCDQERWEEAARALLLCIVGCTLFSDKSAFAINVAFLECFRDLDSCGGYAWGAAGLAHLYDNLCESSLHHTKTIAGYLTLLQAWIYARFPDLCDDCKKEHPGYNEAQPRALRWQPKRLRGLVLPFRRQLDLLTEESVCWTPYDGHRALWPFQEASLYRGWIRWGPHMSAHLPDRVLHQYGFIQTIPPSPSDITGHTTTPEEMDIMFTQWGIHVIDGHPVVHPGQCAANYMDWFRRISHPFIIPRHAPPAADPVPALAPAPDPSPDTGLIHVRMVELMQTLMDLHISPDGMPIARELMQLIHSDHGQGDASSSVQRQTGGGHWSRTYVRNRKRGRDSQ